MDATYDLLVEVLKALANARRLEIIHILGSGPHDASALGSAIATDEGSVRRHLSALMAAGLVEPRRINGTVRYALSDPEVVAACELMRGGLRRRLARRQGSGC